MATTSGKGLYKDLAAVVTGGGTGIGKGIALAFAREGASVAITGRRRDPLDATVAEITKAGGKAVAVTGDVSKPEDCHRIVTEAMMHFRNVHILVNNAGIARFGTLDQTSDEDILAMVNINLTAAMLMTKYASPELVKHKTAGTACILNIGTSAVLNAVKSFSVYSAAKAGLAQFTRCAALDLANEHVRVNCIHPGVVETPIFETMMPASRVKGALESFAGQTPLGRVGQPADIADAALFLCGPKAAWITGAVLTVDGGISLK
jgi:NAD(P)-dependent dehydrogenase (short-subunit alcohol dehydrogenase family)